MLGFWLIGLGAIGQFDPQFNTLDKVMVLFVDMCSRKIEYLRLYLIDILFLRLDIGPECKCVPVDVLA